MSEIHRKVSPNRKDRSHQIKEVARRLFREKGFDNVTMREIAKEIGIGVNVIYRNTESKSSLLADILRDYIQTEVSALKKMPAPEGSPLDTVMAYLEKLYELDLEDFQIRRLGVALSWSWESKRDAEFEELIGLELFAPINNALNKVEYHLDYDARWAIWAIYTEGLRRAGMENFSEPKSKGLKARSARKFTTGIRPQIQFIIRD
jgi:AcrR family transcriptional regulator